MNRTLSRNVSRATLNALPSIARAVQQHGAASTPFVSSAYALGQYCLPYQVDVRTRRAHNPHRVG